MALGENVYISEVNGAEKVKSNAQVATNKNSDPVQNFILRGGCGGQLIFSRLLELSKTSRAKTLIL